METDLPHDIFISYSRKNKDLVLPIKEEIERTLGLRCWIDLSDIPSGSDFIKKIIPAIKELRIAFLFFLSAESQMSEYAMNEIEFARNRAKKRVILVRINDDTMTDEFYFKYHGADIIDWRQPEQKMKLLRDLRTWAEGLGFLCPDVGALHKKIQLWGGGPYWADTNIGAVNPWESGYYFWWGDTIGYKREKVRAPGRINRLFSRDIEVWKASNGSSSGFSFEKCNASTNAKDARALYREGWITAGGVLVPEHDAAHVQWGDHWRIPTIQEQDELCKKCDWIWKTMNGVGGYVIQGRGDYASNSVFLPAAGRGDKASLSLFGSDGNYWSSSACWYGAGEIYFYSYDFSSRHYTQEGWRFYGQPIRPVQ